MIVFVVPLPGTDRTALAGLGDAVIVRAAPEGRGPGVTCWVDAAPPQARAGDHLLIEPGPSRAPAGLRCWWRCRTPRDVHAAVKAGVGAWLLGAEAGGVVGRATNLTLIRALHASGSPRIPWVAAGFTRGARAASIAVGAAGVVLDVTLWGAEGSPLHPDRLRSLAAAGPRQTHLIGDHDGVGLRLMGDPAAIDEQRVRLHQRGLPTIAADLEDWWQRASGPAPMPVSVGEVRSGPAVQLVRDERRALQQHLNSVLTHHPLRQGEDPLGTGVPIVQGPMANVAEGAGLAQAVRAAGALPFVALGALRPAEAEATLDAVGSVPGCGAGLIAFDVAPHRQAHIDALLHRGPRPVILAGGSPALALQLADQGLSPWLHTPSPRLAGLAVGAGVQAVVLEGHEAGGHVGPIPASALWDLGLREVARRSQEGARPLVVLAGGIGDAVSAAFASALAAPTAATGVRIALQAGTAFFFTREIVAAGQITEPCQQVALQASHTVLVGESVNLPLRCAPNAFTEQAVASERAWQTQGLDLTERRHRMESHNVGRTRMAARGVERDPAWDGKDPARRNRAVPTARALEEGAYTLGQGATVTGTLTTVAGLVHALTAGARQVLERRARWGSPRPVSGEPRPVAEGPEIRVPLGNLRGGQPEAAPVAQAGAPIAIVGLGCVLPGGTDLLSWWRSQMRGVDAIQPIPADRWAVGRYTSPGGGATGPAHSASTAAGVASDPAFDALRYRIPPRVLPTVDRAQRLALLAGDEALVEAGFADNGLDPERAAVILGNAMGGEWRSKMAVRVRFREVIDQLIAEGALDAEAAAAVEANVETRLDDGLVPLRPESIVGLLGNLTAGRLAAWLDWQGGSHTVDAACAASLLAVVHAVDALRAGRIDVALTGGVDTDLSIDTYVGFSRTQALSSAGSRPFSRDADGFVMGEGAAAFALVRLQDAVAAGWPVWAVIHGVGTASDGRARGLTAPRAQGQRLAIQRAWADASHDPRQATYVEAHGTGTVLGDRTEAMVLHEIFGAPWVGTAKGAIGHLKSGAGAAGLLRGVLAVATGIVPPTAHVGPPIDEAVPLRVARQATRPDGGIALAGVSAFGFGGTNAHIVLGAPPAGVRRPAAAEGLQLEAEPFLAPTHQARWTPEDPRSPSVLTPSPQLHLFAGTDARDLADAVETGRHCDLEPGAAHRLVLMHVPGTQALDRAAIASALRAGTPLPGSGRSLWHDSLSRPVVVVAPGQGAQRPGAITSLLRFPWVQARLDALQAGLGGPLEAPATPDTRDLHRHLFAVSALWAEVLHAAAIPVHGALGHSLGELAALVAAGRATAEQLAAVARARGEALHAAPPGAMLAVLGDADDAVALAASSGTTVAGLNGPRATVLSGPAEAIDHAAELARGQGLRARRIPVAHAFHSPDVAAAAGPLDDALRGQPWAEGPWWSAAVADSRDPGSALVQAISQPVAFAPTLQHRAPAQALVVELGPGRSLTPHVRALGLRAVALDPDPGADAQGPVRAAAALWASGHAGLLRILPGVDLRLASSRRPVGPAAYRTLPVPAPTVTAATPPASVTVAPARDPAPGKAAPADPGEAPAAVLSALVEVTGYSEQVLAQAADLQADLGVDSIQRLEVVGLLQERLGLSLSDEDQDTLEHASLESLTRVVQERLQRGTREPVAPSEVLAWLHAAEWEGIELATGHPVPSEPGWHRVGEIAVYRADPSDDALDATLALLASLGEAPPEPGAWLALVADHPAGHAVAAALRCAAAERGAVGHECRTTDGEPTGLPQLPDEPALYRTMGGSLQQRSWRPVAASAPLRPRRVLATGGLRGIVSPILRALAPERAIVVGRSGAQDVQHELDDLRSAVPGASYQTADVTDPIALAHALKALGGPPDLILHGAAVLRDRRAGELSPQDVAAVFSPKLTGLQNLRELAPDARIAVLSSVAAHAPSPGQSAYAAANAACEALADDALALTAWAGRGLAAAPHVVAALRTRGLVPLPPALGADAVASALERGGATLITTAPPTHARPWGWPVHHRTSRADREVLRLALDPDHPALADHRVAGRPLVPAAVWLELALHQVECVSDFEIVSPVFVDQARADVRLELQGGAVRVLAGDRMVAQGRTGRRAESPTAASVPPTTSDARPLYRSDLLFHGPTWQALDHIGGDGNGTISGSLQAGATSATTIDAAHQLLACWAARHVGWTGLPMGADAWTRFDGGDPVVLSARPHEIEGGLSSDVVALDAHGQVVLHGRGVVLRRTSTVTAEALAVLDRLVPGGPRA